MSDTTTVPSSTVEPSDPHRDAPVDARVSPEQPLIQEDLLVEDVSIDGMCGVY